MDERPTTLVTFRFYEELNRFLPPGRRKVDFAHALPEGSTLRFALDALGVPASEADLVLVGGIPSDLDRVLAAGDRVSVYPVFESFDIASVTALAGRPLRTPRFVLDVHLAKLARLLRLLGFDTLHRTDWGPGEPARVAAAESRILLGRGAAVLASGVDRGYRVRSEDPRGQLLEVLRRLDLRALAMPFTRCLPCNGVLAPVAKDLVRDRLPPRAAQLFDEFLLCPDCGRVYWQGSHWERLRRVVEEALARPGGE